MAASAIQVTLKHQVPDTPKVEVILQVDVPMRESAVSCEGPRLLEIPCKLVVSRPAKMKRISAWWKR